MQRIISFLGSSFKWTTYNSFFKSVRAYIFALCYSVLSYLFLKSQWNFVLQIINLSKIAHFIFIFYRRYNEFEVSNKNILVFADVCNKSLCSSCIPYECQLCFNCLTQDNLNTLKEAYMEHTNRQACKRIFPPLMVNTILNIVLIFI